MTALHWGDPQTHFWLRHTRKAQEPILLFGDDAEQLTTLLTEQLVTTIATPADDQFPRAGMIGLTNGVFTRQGTLTAQVAWLERYHQRLMVGGKLVVVAAIPAIEMIGRAAAQGGWSAPMEELPLPDSAGHLYRWRTTRCEPIAQTLTHHDILEQTDEQGVVIKRWHTHTTESYCFPNEVRLMLERTGYLIEAAYGGWNDEPLEAGAALQIWVARKGVSKI
jgi:hypothetical protein